jgi:hypothetical protein
VGGGWQGCKGWRGGGRRRRESREGGVVQDRGMGNDKFSKESFEPCVLTFTVYKDPSKKYSKRDI